MKDKNPFRVHNEPVGFAKEIVYLPSTTCLRIEKRIFILTEN